MDIRERLSRKRGLKGLARGFTVLELVAVLVILGILGGLGTVVYPFLIADSEDNTLVTSTRAAIRDGFAGQTIKDGNLLDIDQGETETGVSLVIEAGEIYGLRVSLAPGTDGTELDHYVIGDGDGPGAPEVPEVGTLLSDSGTGWWNVSWGTNDAFHTTNITADASTSVELYTGTVIDGATPVCTVNGSGSECDITTSWVSSQNPWGGHIFPTTCSGRTTIPHVSCPAWAMSVSFTYDDAGQGAVNSAVAAGNTAIIDFSGNSTGDWRNVFRTGVYMASSGQVEFLYGDHYNALNWAPPVDTLIDGEDYTMEIVYDGTLTGVASGSIDDYYAAFSIELFQG